MSDSYKHNAVLTRGPHVKLHGFSTRALEKKRANKVIRRLPIEEPISDGAEFKRLYNSINITDRRADFRWEGSDGLGNLTVHQVFMK